jgi:glycogen debranching enzyme
MSYHNGSVWPHDNALIAWGLSRYGLTEPALKIFSGLFDASASVEWSRLPELFCGFPRRPGEGPTLYPVACSPQAWASSAAFMLLQACLGLSIHAPTHHVRFVRPALPESVPDVRLRGLRVGGATVDLLIERHDRDVGLKILRRTGQVNVEMVK